MVTDNLRRVRALANHVDPARGVPAHHRPGFTVAVLGAAGGIGQPLSPVSYTHLTLPTILLV